MIRLKNPQTNVVKECATGYSWTTFFFGMFVPLIRGDLKWAAIFFLLTFLVGIFTVGFGSFLCGPIFAAFYNKIFITSIVEKGYVGQDEPDKEWLIENKVVAKNN
jgi:hypothetical protein